MPLEVVMIFFNSGASFFVPDGVSQAEAYRRTTHLGIGAHSDDLEIMAFHGIRLCIDDPEKWFGGVTCTNGSGSSRTGKFAQYSDEQMIAVRKKEQEKAAEIGKYSFAAQLDFTSSDIKNSDFCHLENDIFAILSETHPRFIYTHNPADKHETHIAVVIAALNAIRRLPSNRKPLTVYGCEVWRDLDWMMDEDKIALDVTDPGGLGETLVDVFESQIEGGKRYDLATLGRRNANATYYQSHQTDNAGQLHFAMDLTPPALNDDIDILDYVNHFINRFQQDVEANLKRFKKIGNRQ
jgi:LmbE family N-acetylglucosaminyl deacetylase